MVKIVRKYYNEQYKLHYKHFEINGKINGEYKSYYDNGKLDVIFNSIDGKKN